MSGRDPGSYVLLMNAEQNALNRLPKVLRFQIMVFLSVMWSTVFSLAIGSWFWWGERIVGHVAIALTILITSLTFRQVHRSSAAGDI